jgi:hypothetical protein
LQVTGAAVKVKMAKHNKQFSREESCPLPLPPSSHAFAFAERRRERNIHKKGGFQEIAPSSQYLTRRKIRLIEVNAKCHHLKKITRKRTLRQGFIKVYRLDIQSVMLVFSTQLCELLPL